jgi:hypothetical protein
MGEGTKPFVRLNIYLPEASMRRRVKSAAARRDISVSEYCVRAILSQLEEEGDSGSEEQATRQLAQAVRRARQFQREVLGGKVFRVSSADLIEEARSERARVHGNRRR